MFVEKSSDIDTVRVLSILKFYRFAAYVTGIFLLLLCLQMFFKYILEWEFIVGGIADPLSGEILGGFNVGRAILVIHGWLYVVYLFASFRLWMAMRWSFVKIVVLALGGVVPFLSFPMERRVGFSIKQQL